MKTNKTLVTTMLGILLVSIAYSQQITIKGKLEKGRGTMVYLNKYVGNSMAIIDSSKANFFGNYEFNLEVPQDDFYSLTTAKSGNEALMLILKKDEKVKLKSKTDFANKDYKVSGSADSKLLQEYYATKNSGLSKDSMSSYAFDFVKKNSSSLAVFATFNDIINPKEAINIAAKGIGESYPNSGYHQSLVTAQQQIIQAERKQQLQPEPKTPIGSVAPEVNMTSPEGKLITLESLRGKYVLIDFWASWCGPCRRENPNVVSLYNKYKDQGFEVYSVSLDQNKEAWEAAIIKDNLVWQGHVSDLRGWGSAATKIYGFSGIPYTVLIDKEGKIIGTRLRGPALEAKLQEIFGN